jgi:predicted RNA-binding protein with PUA-like domain
MLPVNGWRDDKGVCRRLHSWRTTRIDRTKAVSMPKAPAKKAAKKPAPKNPLPKRRPGEPSYWLMKSEPDAFSWDNLKAKGAAGEPWTGVRNFLARNNMKAMQVGDLGFFYHSNIGLDVVGILKVIALAHPDPSDDTGKWECVDVIAVADVPKPVSLAAIKETPSLSKMSLVTSMRLSVQPVTPQEWRTVCKMGGIDPKFLTPV